MKLHSKAIKVIIACLIILALALAVYLGKIMFFEPATNNATDKLMTEIVSSTLSDQDAAKVNSAIAKMSESDRQEVKRILDESIDMQDLPKLASYYQNEETDKIISYANDHLSDEDREKLIQLYMKYA